MGSRSLVVRSHGLYIAKEREVPPFGRQLEGQLDSAKTIEVVDLPALDEETHEVKIVSASSKSEIGKD